MWTFRCGTKEPVFLFYYLFISYVGYDGLYEKKFPVASFSIIQD